MEIYFSINDREIVLEADIDTSLVEYQHKNINNNPVYKINLNGLNIEKVHFCNLKNNNKVVNDPKKFLKNLYLNTKEFRFIIINEKLKLENSNFIGILEKFELVGGLLFATIKKK